MTLNTRKPNPHHRSSAINRTCNDIVGEFTSAMLSAGIETRDAIIPDGLLHRIHLEGHRHGSRNGAYLLHGDRNSAGWFMDFKTGVTGTWKAGGGRWRLDEATRQQIEADKRKRKAEAEARYTKTAIKAQELWAAANPCVAHHYLTRKGIQAHGLRVADWVKWEGGPGNWRSIVIPDALLIPLRDEAGAIWNLQAIFPESHPLMGRDKDFMPGRKAGLFHEIGEATPTIMVCEGYATGASVHAMTGKLTLVAFDAGNLKAVAMAARSMYPHAEIIIAGDCDPVGVTKAKEAALAVRGRISIPSFPKGSAWSDWNDYAQMEVSHG